ncbi:MAG: hypothetical protein AB7L66_06020 [Gemmatimonadales bacterium]
MRRTALLIPVLALTACIFGSDAERVNIGIQYTQLIDSIPTDAPKIEQIGTTIQLIHHFSTPNSCYDFGSSAEQQGSVVEVKLTLAAGGGSCSGGTAYWGYVAQLNGVTTDANRLGITYELDGSPSRTEHAIPTP